MLFPQSELFLEPCPSVLLNPPMSFQSVCNILVGNRGPTVMILDAHVIFMSKWVYPVNRNLDLSNIWGWIPFLFFFNRRFSFCSHASSHWCFSAAVRVSPKKRKFRPFEIKGPNLNNKYSHSQWTVTLTDGPEVHPLLLPWLRSPFGSHVFKQTTENVFLCDVTTDTSSVMALSG